MSSLNTSLRRMVDAVCESTLDYLLGCSEKAPGEYFGSFWSEKGYHGPLLDYHAGGSHHHRAAGSSALALWLVGRSRGRQDMCRAAEHGFDWLVARQRSRGGYPEIQNNECEADWERTGKEELSSIAAGFVAHGLTAALLAGLPPKASYFHCLQNLAHWQVSLEWPAASGVFPHHERSPYNTLNAAAHAAETMGASFAVLRKIYDLPIALFFEGALRARNNILACQWDNGCFPYRDYGNTTINYTSLVMWCLLNLEDVLEAPFKSRFFDGELCASLASARAFLRSCVAEDGALLWEGNEYSTAKRNAWTYAITANVLLRGGGREDQAAAERLLGYLLSLRTSSGLLPMRDYGEEITECAFMQADMLLFLLPFSSILGEKE